MNFFDILGAYVNYPSSNGKKWPDWNELFNGSPKGSLINSFWFSYRNNYSLNFVHIWHNLSNFAFYLNNGVSNQYLRTLLPESITYYNFIFDISFYFFFSLFFYVLFCFLTLILLYILNTITLRTTYVCFFLFAIFR